MSSCNLRRRSSRASGDFSAERALGLFRLTLHGRKHRFVNRERDLLGSSPARIIRAPAAANTTTPAGGAIRTRTAAKTTTPAGGAIRTRATNPTGGARRTRTAAKATTPTRGAIRTRTSSSTRGAIRTRTAAAASNRAGDATRTRTTAPASVPAPLSLINILQTHHVFGSRSTALELHCAGRSLHGDAGANVCTRVSTIQREI